MGALSDSWGPFFEAAISIFLFGIGIPSLIIQTSITDDIKRVAFRNTRWTYIWVFIAIVIGFVNLSFIWIIHPTQSLLNSYLIQFTDNLLVENTYLLAAVLMTTILLIVYWVWWGQFNYDRKKIIHQESSRYIKTTCRRMLRIKLSKWVKHNFRGPFKVVKGPILQLINLNTSIPDIWGLQYLGENGAGGFEKQMVLESFQEIVELIYRKNTALPPIDILIDVIKAIKATINTHATNKNYLTGIRTFESIIIKINSEYQGNRDVFMEIIRSIETTIKNAEVNEEKYRISIIAIANVISASVNIDKLDSPSIGLGLRTLQRLADIAFKEDYQLEVGRIIGVVASSSLGPDHFSPEVARILLELGTTALYGGYNNIAVEILNRFESMMEQYEFLSADIAQYYLGLVAHFWYSGESAKQRVSIGLEKMNFKPSRKSCLKRAKELHYSATRFETADLLAKMIN